ncbi:uncharacterized protein LOC121405836 [Lytechinus variegatus]|uniref:uncharacterized protein LOC121405836 n=1 Tax=Lytechinus variegatus TaxID=7654 RepID=UPI001BB237A6|nr:uncharacterized protein LOC121405836 [Lytechinus variegatus]XP_041452738.1 uncharacterized protein LOC121405836 [Lytechinus variegatus]
MSTQLDNRFGGHAAPPTVTREDIRQIELFFCSLKSKVYVCPALCNLYFASLEEMANLGGWELQTTGFPTLIFDTGALRRTPRLQLCIAEKGTGFVKWKEDLGLKTMYKAPGDKFHTITLSSDSRRIAGLSFDDQNAAADLLRTAESWLQEKCAMDRESAADADKKKKKKKSKSVKVILPRKETISLPCQFEHITRIDSKNISRKLNSAQSMDVNDSEEAYDQHARIATYGKTKQTSCGYAESTSTEDSGLDEIFTEQI